MFDVRMEEANYAKTSELVWKQTCGGFPGDKLIIRIKVGKRECFNMTHSVYTRNNSAELH